MSTVRKYHFVARITLDGKQHRFDAVAVRPAGMTAEKFVESLRHSAAVMFDSVFDHLVPDIDVKIDSLCDLGEEVAP
jgi:hypothetical protein